MKHAHTLAWRSVEYSRLLCLEEARLEIILIRFLADFDIDIDLCFFFRLSDGTIVMV